MRQQKSASSTQEQVAVLQQLIAKLAGVDSQDLARENPRSFSDNEIAALLDDYQAKGVVMENVSNVFGPYAHGGKYRIRLVFRDGTKPKWKACPTPEAAEEEIKKLEKAMEREATLTVSEALTKYRHHLLHERELAVKGVGTTALRISNFFEPCGMDTRLANLSPELGKKLFKDLGRRASRMGVKLTPEQKASYAQDWGVKVDEVPDRLLAHATKRNTVHEVKTFMVWCHEQGHGARKGAFAELKLEKKKWKIKPKFDLAQAVKFIAYVSKLADEGHEGAIAALVALYMALRSSEVTKRLVGDLKQDCQVLYLGITKDGEETELIIPIQVRGYLQKLAGDRGPNEPLFPHLAFLDSPKDWLLRETVRFCKEAGVPRVTPHGLRRTMSSLVARKGGLEDASEFLRQKDKGVTARKSYIPDTDSRQGDIERLQDRLARA